METNTSSTTRWSQVGHWITKDLLDLDAYLSALNPLWGNPHRARVLALVPVSGGIQFTFSPSARFSLPDRARFVTVGVDVDGARLRRDLLVVQHADADPSKVRALLRPEPDSGAHRLFLEHLTVGRVIELAPRAPKASRRARRATPVARGSESAAPSTFWEQYDTEVSASAGQTLLEAAEAAGLSPTFGCRAGVCRRCSIPLVGGTVVDVRDGRTTEGGMHIQPCTVAAATPCRVDAVS